VLKIKNTRIRIWSFIWHAFFVFFCWLIPVTTGAIFFLSIKWKRYLLESNWDIYAIAYNRVIYLKTLKCYFIVHRHDGNKTTCLYFEVDLIMTVRNDFIFNWYLTYFIRVNKHFCLGVIYRLQASLSKLDKLWLTHCSLAKHSFSGFVIWLERVHNGQWYDQFY
jgi:hypothetical protein